MDKNKIHGDFLNLNFNRVNKKQKLKARNYIVNSLQGLYKLKSDPKLYKLFGVIPYSRCYNLESENPDYEILFTAHYDTHSIRQNYIQSFVTRKVQYSNTFFIKFLYFVFFLIFPIILASKLSIYLSISNSLSALISLVVIMITFIGFPVRITSKINSFKLAPIHDDNNSGVITLIHLANLLYKKGYSDKIKLLFTDCEEKGMLGSKLFVKDNFHNLKDKLIVNLDCVARGDNLFITSQNNAKLANDLQCLFLSKGISSTLYNKSFSDDKSFQKKGLNSAGIIRADKDYKGNKLLHWTHTSHDRLDDINIDYIIEIIEVITEFIELKISHSEKH